MATDTPSVAISHARSLRALPLQLLRTTSWTGQCPIRLDTSELATLVHALQTSSQSASARLAHNALAHVTDSQTMGPTTASQHADCGVLRCPHEVVTALHRILTRSRFLKGSRSCYPLETALAQMLPFVDAQQPITVVTIGFPFKQHDNGLKAAGPCPDLAELGALLMLKELHDAITALYPPGLQIVVLNDGGYWRPRSGTEIQRYRHQLRHYAQLIGLAHAMRFCDQARFVTQLLGPQAWDQRERYRRSFRDLILLLAHSSCSLHQATRIDQQLAQALPRALLTEVPSFHDILASLVYSVPIPTQPNVDPRQWACQVLAHPDEFTTPGLSPDLIAARRQVITSAWQESVTYLAASLADTAAEVTHHFPPHIRLATVASRPGCSGFTYLGGSTLLPWHGTGCLDGRGLLCADFLVSLDHRGFLPVYCELLSDDQPLLMVPLARTVYSQHRRRVDPHLLTTARLRSR